MWDSEIGSNLTKVTELRVMESHNQGLLGAVFCWSVTFPALARERPCHHHSYSPSTFHSVLAILVVRESQRDEMLIESE